MTDDTHDSGDPATERTVIQKDGARGVTRLGRYALRQRLGVGGMAEVYLAEQDGPQQFKKRVVVKRILPSLAADPAFVQLFVREAQVAAKLSHTNIVQIYELGEQVDGASTEYFIAMEFIDGITLQRMASACWAAGKAVPVDVVMRCIADAARGLQAAHTLTDDNGKRIDLVHRDISPDNLMVTRDGVTKILDFGIAKGDLGGPKTKTGNVRGKIPYMSPEQVTGLTLDGRTDLYALGVSMYWLLCGERPFDRNTDYHTMQAVMVDKPKSPRSINPNIPAALDAIIIKLLHKDRDQRFAHAEELADALDALAPPGGARKATVQLVASVSGPGSIGNPLSEVDGARAPMPLSHDGPMLRAQPDAVVAATIPDARSDPATSVLDASTLPPPAHVVAPPAAPPQASTPPPASTSRAEAGASLPPMTQQFVADAPARAAVHVDATLATPVPTLPPPAPPALPAPALPPPAPAPMFDSGNHPIIDMLAPKSEGLPSWVALAGVLGTMALVAVCVMSAIVYVSRHRSDDVVVHADAGTRAVVVDAGVVVVAPPAVVDAGVRVVDAGVRVVDAGAVALVVDAGVAAVRDAGTIAEPKPLVPTGLAVRSNAPARIRWELLSGKEVGRGSETFYVPKGTTRLVAADRGRQRRDELAITTSANKGSTDYAALLSATLAIKAPPGVRVLLGDEEYQDGAIVRAAPGSYTLRAFVGTERTIVRATAVAAKSVTVDVTAALAKAKPKQK